MKKKVSRQSRKSTPANDTKAPDPPATLGKALYAHLTKRGKRLNKVAAARLLGITPLKVQALLDDQSEIDAELALKLGDVFQTDPEYWLAFQAARDLARARVARAVRADWDKPISHSPWWPHVRYFWKALNSGNYHQFVESEPELRLCLYQKELPKHFTSSSSADLYSRFVIYYVERLEDGKVTLWLDRTVVLYRPTRRGQWDILSADTYRVDRFDRGEIIDLARRVVFGLEWDHELGYFNQRQKRTITSFQMSSIQ